ncbi:hypothetical protein ADICYQ_4894 [Cyclobacterium qasimii M12-11B]|uniref:Uncharacterized protein n=1 Tax=Cyclobacterium qasimii M12-11B TaxID=641524 RepID=S7V8I9_9BACT|nr:hypothetical protein ADICYQ_4894 [Cyclobacterium qasimii M12-11B]
MIKGSVIGELYCWWRKMKIDFTFIYKKGSISHGFETIMDVFKWF